MCFRTFSIKSGNLIDDTVKPPNRALFVANEMAMTFTISLKQSALVKNK
jgi:hypothetical protein